MNDDGDMTYGWTPIEEHERTGMRQTAPTETPPSTRPEHQQSHEQRDRGVSRISALALAVVAGAVGAMLSGAPVGDGGGGNDRLEIIERSAGAVLQVQAEDGREGSGVLLGDDGYIVTNTHVVGDAEMVVVVTGDGREENALVVGTDRASDIALLRTGGTGRTPGLQLRDLDEEPLRQGETVIAIGSPFGFSGSVTEGIVSGTGRNLRMGPADLLTGLLQTDAAINPGNSGGPLIDSEGRVVGINSALASTTGRGQGFGFAVPADTVTRVVADLLAVGYVRYAQMGVMVGEVEERDGAAVAAVSAGSAAEQAGVMADDRIVAVDGTRIGDSADLVAVVRRSRPGDTLTVTIERDGERLQLQVTLGEVEAPER